MSGFSQRSTFEFVSAPNVLAPVNLPKLPAQQTRSSPCHREGAKTFPYEANGSEPAGNDEAPEVPRTALPSPLN